MTDADDHAENWRDFVNTHTDDTVAEKLAELDDERTEWVKIAGDYRAKMDQMNVRDMVRFLLDVLRPASHTVIHRASLPVSGTLFHDMLTYAGDTITVELRDGRQYAVTVKCTRGAK